MMTPSNGGHGVSTGHLLSRKDFWCQATFSWVFGCGDSSKQTRLMLEQMVAPHKLTAGRYCQGQDSHSSVNVERSRWCLHGDFISFFLSLWYEKVYCRLPQRQMCIPIHLQNPWLIICPSCEMCWSSGGLELVGVANEYLLWFKAHYMRRSPYQTLIWWSGTRDWTARWPKVEPNMTGLKIHQWNIY